jgi:preprotein translocase subunit SecE
LAKQKVPSKFKQKEMMEKKMKERKAPSPSRQKVDWKKFVKALPKKMTRYFRGVVQELKKVSWPTRKELVKYTIIVLATIAFFAVILGLFDYLFIRAVELLARI